MDGKLGKRSLAKKRKGKEKKEGRKGHTQKNRNENKAGREDTHVGEKEVNRILSIYLHSLSASLLHCYWS